MATRMQKIAPMAMPAFAAVDRAESDWEEEAGGRVVEVVEVEAERVG